MVYEHDTTTPQGGLVYCRGDVYQGWLRDFADKTVWYVYHTLQDALDDVNAFKEFGYVPNCECYEEEVIEHWLDTGEDA